MFRWGILGTGSMGSLMVGAIREAGGEVAAIGSRSSKTAGAFADRHGVRRWYGAYEDLAAADGIDAVYVASTNQRHRDDTLMCLSAGKAVLCEKPFALDANQALEMVEAARSAGVFLMEAMWMAFQPSTVTLGRILGDGAIGTVHHVRAGFGFPADLDPAGRLASPDLGGGALLDIGVYPLTLIHSLLGMPDAFEAGGVIGPTGVDVQAEMQSRHGDATASATVSFLADIPQEAEVSGSEGSLHLAVPFHHSPMITLRRRGETQEVWACPVTGSPYRSQVEEVHRCLSGGATESDQRPLDDTVEVLRWMDGVTGRLRVPGR